MFHKAIKLEFGKGVLIKVTFQDGKVKLFDMSTLFGKYPQLKALKNRLLFTKGKLSGGYGIIWNDDLDIEAETIYEEGETIADNKTAPNIIVGEKVLAARASKAMSQKELSNATGIDQSDISKIERGLANPSVGTLNRIAAALGARLDVQFV